MALELEGVRVLVVEDRAAVAMALCDRLADRGATIVGPAAKLPQAVALSETTPFDVAVLDIDLGGDYTYDLARAIRARDIPVLLMTGYDVRTLPEDLRAFPLFDKLDPVTELTRAVADLVRIC